MKTPELNCSYDRDFNVGRALPMANSDGLGYDVLRTKRLVIQRIWFAPGSGVDTHTHPIANHILEVKAGVGSLIYEDQEVRLKPGLHYEVPAGIPHAIIADSAGHDGLDLKVISDYYVPVDSTQRLEGGGSLKNTFTS